MEYKKKLKNKTPKETISTDGSYIDKDKKGC